jgi:hypothetical protein
MLLLVAVLYLLFVAIGFVGLDRFLPDREERAFMVPVILVLLIIGIVFMARRRIPAIVESQAFLLGDTELTFMQNGRSIASITHDRIDRIEVDDAGTIFVIGPGRSAALEISADYENVDDLREQLSLLHDIQPRQRRSLPMRYRQILGLLFLVPFGLLFASDAPAIVIAAAAITIVMMGWHFIEWIRAYGFRGIGGKLIGPIALLTGIIVIRTLVVLGVLGR